MKNIQDYLDFQEHWEYEASMLKSRSDVTHDIQLGLGINASSLIGQLNTPELRQSIANSFTTALNDIIRQGEVRDGRVRDIRTNEFGDAKVDIEIVPNMSLSRLNTTISLRGRDYL